MDSFQLLEKHSFSVPQEQPHGFSFGVAVAFTVNYIMGTGFLTLPWAFEQTGVVLGVLVLFLMGCICNVSKDMVLETMARADAYTRKLGGAMIENGHVSITAPLRADSLDSSPGSEKSEGLLVKQRKFELPELCVMFLGDQGRRAYMVFVCIYLYGAMWAYASVWGNALAAHLELGFCANEYCSYLLYLVLFAALCVPLTCMELTEQVYVQVTLAICRVLLVFFMIVSVLFAYGLDNHPFTDVDDAPRGTKMFDITGLHIILPISCYAFIFHHSLPALSQPVIEKRSLSKIFGVTFVLCWFAYSAIGGVVAGYFGDDVESSSNLNWQKYAGTARGEHLWYCDFVSFFVVLFPALDVASAFPLNGITLGNNLMFAIYGDRMAEVEKDKRTKISFRLLAAIPPMIGACFVRDLGTITDYAGIAGFVIIFIFPAMLAHKSREAMINVGLDPTTHYSSMFTSPTWIKIVGVVGVFMFMFVIISVGIYGSP